MPILRLKVFLHDCLFCILTWWGNCGDCRIGRRFEAAHFAGPIWKSLGSLEWRSEQVLRRMMPFWRRRKRTICWSKSKMLFGDSVELRLEYPCVLFRCFWTCWCKLCLVFYSIVCDEPAEGWSFDNIAKNFNAAFQKSDHYRIGKALVSRDLKSLLHLPRQK